LPGRFRRLHPKRATVTGERWRRGGLGEFSWAIQRRQELRWHYRLSKRRRWRILSSG